MVKSGPRYHNSNGTTIMPLVYGQDREFELDRLKGGFAKYGKMHLREHDKESMDDWMAGHGIQDLVPAKISLGISIPTKGVYEIAGAPKDGIKVAKGRLEVNMRDTGKYLSKMYQLQEDVIRFLRSDAGAVMQEHFASQGMSIEDIEHLAIGELEGAFAAIGPGNDGKITLYANASLFAKSEEFGKLVGLTAKQMKELVIAEELSHNYRRSYDRVKVLRGTLARLAMIPEEIATKEEVIEIYRKLADHATDGAEKTHYKQMVRVSECDLESAPTTYALAALRGRFKKSSQLEALVASYVSEAVEEGKTLNEEIVDYVASRVEAAMDEAEHDDGGSVDAKGGDSGAGSDEDSGEEASDSGGE